MSNKVGSLVISLDFELLWGVFDKISLEAKREYFKNTRKVLPEILKKFENSNINATWATVGMLFNNDWDEWNSNIPNDIPEYKNKNLCAYSYGKKIQSKANEELCFAPELIKRIISTKGQELATHTYSHYYCLENGQNIHQFEKDIEKAIKMAKTVEVELRSLVFPRNQFNPNYLEACTNKGLQNFRINPNVWYWAKTKNDNFLQKIFRTGDAYIGFKDKSYNNSEIQYYSEGYNLQKASRLLRAYMPSPKFLNYLKIKRILSEMEYAARTGEVYHLWWHPHNFGDNQVQNLNDLEIILRHFKTLEFKYGYRSQSMDSLPK